MNLTSDINEKKRLIKVMISDFEVLTNIGTSVDQFEKNLFAGQSGISNLDCQYGKDFPIKATGLVSSLEGRREPNVVAKDLLIAILNRHSRLQIDGVVFFIPSEDELVNSTPPFSTDQQIELIKQTILESTGFAVPTDQFIAIHEGCVSGLSGLSLAAQRIRLGHWKQALVLGVDLRCSPIDLLRFHAIGALSRREAAEASRPFSLERDGFVKSQGGAVLLLEGQADPREGQYWGEIRGYGQTSDAWRLTEGRAECRGAVGAIKRALEMSGLSPQDIDCFSAHATSTPLGDALESRAIHLVWGKQASQLPVTALKSQIGHAGQVSGLLQVVAGVLMIKSQRVAPTINYRTYDPSCALDCVPNYARQLKIDHLLCNATAFGGQNACLILSSPVGKVSR